MSLEHLTEPRVQEVIGKHQKDTRGSLKGLLQATLGPSPASKGITTGMEYNRLEKLSPYQNRKEKREEKKVSSFQRNANN